MKEKSRSSSSRRRERSRSRGRRERSRHDRGGHGKGQRMIKADTEWNAIGCEREQVQRARQALPSPSMQSRALEQQYNPWQGQVQGQMPGAQQMNMGYQQQALYPQTYSQTYQQTFQQPWPHNVTPFTTPAPMPQQHTTHTAIPVPWSISSVPAYQKPPRKAFTERSESQAKPKPVPKERPRVRRDDFIHCVDDYPDIIKDSMQKAATKASSSSSSSSSSTSTESAEEVPRKTIPQAATRFAQPQPFHFPQNPYLTAPTWDAPTSHPRQWNDNTGGPDEQRYASPYTRPEAWTSRPHAPSNIPPRRSALVLSCWNEPMLT